MKPIFLFLVVISFCVAASYAQPVRSPKARAAADAQWMHDSAHLTPTQMAKVQPILLNYQQQMDNNSKDDKKQHALMDEKDQNIKKILDKQQYKIYYRREEQIRAKPKRDPNARRQAY